MPGGVFYSVPKGMEERVRHAASGKHAYLAQLVEQVTRNHKVVGSTPAICTMEIIFGKSLPLVSDKGPNPPLFHYRTEAREAPKAERVSWKSKAGRRPPLGQSGKLSWLTGMRLTPTF